MDYYYRIGIRELVFFNMRINKSKLNIEWLVSLLVYVVLLLLSNNSTKSFNTEVFSIYKLGVTMWDFLVKKRRVNQI